MNLIEEIEKKRASFTAGLNANQKEIMQASTDALKQSNLVEKAIKTGGILPEFELPNVANQKVSLSSLLRRGSLIISFYRGGWCPYCNLELKALQEILPQAKELGAQLIAISPETPDNSLSTSEKNELNFEVLSDLGNMYAKELGLVFEMPEDLRKLYLDDFSIDVTKYNGNNDFELPMPATYVVNSEGKIIHHFIPADYLERLDPQKIVEALKAEE